jgi:hypothetical protein
VTTPKTPSRPTTEEQEEALFSRMQWPVKASVTASSPKVPSRPSPEEQEEALFERMQWPVKAPVKARQGHILASSSDGERSYCSLCERWVRASLPASDHSHEMYRVEAHLPGKHNQQDHNPNHKAPKADFAKISKLMYDGVLKKGDSVAWGQAPAGNGSGMVKYKVEVSSSGTGYKVTVQLPGKPWSSAGKLVTDPEKAYPHVKWEADKDVIDAPMTAPAQSPVKLDFLSPEDTSKLDLSKFDVGDTVATAEGGGSTLTVSKLNDTNVVVKTDDGTGNWTLPLSAIDEYSLDWEVDAWGVDSSKTGPSFGNSVFAPQPNNNTATPIPTSPTVEPGGNSPSIVLFAGSPITKDSWSKVGLESLPPGTKFATGDVGNGDHTDLYVADGGKVGVNYVGYPMPLGSKYHDTVSPASVSALHKTVTATVDLPGKGDSPAPSSSGFVPLPASKIPDLNYGKYSSGDTVLLGTSASGDVAVVTWQPKAGEMPLKIDFGGGLPVTTTSVGELSKLTDVSWTVNPKGQSLGAPPASMSPATTVAPQPSTATVSVKTQGLINGTWLSAPTTNPWTYGQQALSISQKTGTPLGQVVQALDTKFGNDPKDANSYTGTLGTWLQTAGGKNWAKKNGLTSSSGAVNTNAPPGPAATPQSSGAYSSLDVQTLKPPANEADYKTKLPSQMGSHNAGPPPQTNGQINALKTYTGTTYTKINGYLRGVGGYPETPYLKGLVKQMSSGMRPLKFPMKSFRGSDLKVFGVTNVGDLQKMVGKTVTDKGFMSTSINEKKKFGGQVSMEIHLPTGAKVSYVAGFSQHPGEQELLLDKGMQYKIKSVEKDPTSSGWEHSGGKVKVVLEVVGPHSEPVAPPAANVPTVPAVSPSSGPVTTPVPSAVTPSVNANVVSVKAEAAQAIASKWPSGLPASHPAIYGAQALGLANKHKEPIGHILQNLDALHGVAPGDPGSKSKEFYDWLQTEKGANWAKHVNIPTTSPTSSSASNSYSSNVPSPPVGPKQYKTVDSITNAPPPLLWYSKKSLEHWTAHFGAINKYLRGLEPGYDNAPQHVKNMLKGMRPLQDDVEAWRISGMDTFGVSSFDQLEKMVGKTVNDKGFTAVSLKKDNPEILKHPVFKKPGMVDMVVRMPKGTMGHYLDEFSQFPGQKEFLIQAGSSYKIVEVKPPTTPGGRPQVIVEVIV